MSKQLWIGTSLLLVVLSQSWRQSWKAICFRDTNWNAASPWPTAAWPKAAKRLWTAPEAALALLQNPLHKPLDVFISVRLCESTLSQGRRSGHKPDGMAY